VLTTTKTDVLLIVRPPPRAIAALREMRNSESRIAKPESNR
jgi:hypothetical protein